METYGVEPIRAFGLESSNRVIIESMNPYVLCCEVECPDGRKGLLWHIKFSKDKLNMENSDNTENCFNDETEWYAHKISELQEVNSRNPNTILIPERFELRRSKRSGSTMELFLLTPYCTTLVRRYPEGLSKEDCVRRLGVQLCEKASNLASAGVPYGCVTPERVMFGEDGETILAPWWPGVELEKPTFFFVPKQEVCQTSYSIAMLLYWLLNQGQGPFTANARNPIDAEQRRFNGEELSLPGQGGELAKLLCNLCQLPIKEKYSLEKLKALLSQQVKPKDESGKPQIDPEEETAEDEVPAHVEEEKKDKLFLLGTIVVCIAVIITVSGWIMTRNQFRVDHAVKQGSYASALDMMETYYNAGENIDEMVDDFIDLCLSNEDYVRAIAACQFYSNELEPDEARIERLISTTVYKEGTIRAERFLNSFSYLNDSCAKLANNLYDKYCGVEK